MKRQNSKNQWTECAAVNSRFAKAAVQRFADIFVVKSATFSKPKNVCGNQ
jgi:hypothetical protein